MPDNSRRKNSRKRALTSTERSQRRRRLMMMNNVKELRIEMSETEREMTSRTALAMGYSNTTDYIRTENIKNAEKHGINCADIKKELSEGKESQDNITDEA